MVRTHRIVILLNDDEVIRLDKAVMRSGLTRSSYIRSVLKRRIPKDNPPPDYHSMMESIRAVGGVLKEAAARAHAVGSPDAALFMKYADDYFRIMGEIRNEVLLPFKVTK